MSACALSVYFIIHNLTCAYGTRALHFTLFQGDYDRQLHKMAVAAQRKQAVLGKMLDVTSRHLLLLLLGSQERSRLAALATELEGTKAQLEGHVESVQSRTNRCVHLLLPCVFMLRRLVAAAQHRLVCRLCAYEGFLCCTQVQLYAAVAV